MRVRFVASGSFTNNAVRSCEGPWGAKSGDNGGVVALGVPGVGVGALRRELRKVIQGGDVLLTCLLRLRGHPQYQAGWVQPHPH